MATPRLKEVWVSKDGKEFPTEEMAIKHEEIDAIDTFLRDHDDLYFGREGSADPYAIACALHDAYIMTPKLKKGNT